MKFIFAKIAVAGVLVSCALSACIVAPAPGYGGSEVVAYAQPPALQVEAVGVAPSPGFFWIGGGWLWQGGRYVWGPGHWQAPRPGYRWVPHTWRRVGNSWHSQPGAGHWQHYR